MSDDTMNAVTEEVETAQQFDGDTGAAAGDEGFGGEGKLDPQQADAHEGEILSVTLTEAGTGTKGLEIQTKSLNTGIDNRGFLLTIWGPQDLFNPDAECWAEGRFDNTKLPATPPPGKKQSQAQAYARNFFNSKKTGTVQLAIEAAREEGRSVATLGLSTPTTPEEYVANLGAVLTGTRVIVVRKPEKNDDPKFDGQLKVSALYPASYATSQPGIFAKLRRMWE